MIKSLESVVSLQTFNRSIDFTVLLINRLDRSPSPSVDSIDSISWSIIWDSDLRGAVCNKTLEVRANSGQEILKTMKTCDNEINPSIFANRSGETKQAARQMNNPKPRGRAENSLRMDGWGLRSGCTGSEDGAWDEHLSVEGVLVVGLDLEADERDCKD